MSQVKSIVEFLDTVSRNSGLRAAILEPDATELEEVNDQLADFYAASGRGYLNSPEHCALDALLGLGRRSRTVTVRDRTGRLVSTVRVTPHPFKVESLMPLEAKADSFHGHFELSRLVSWHGDKFRTLSSTLALGTALLHAWSAEARGLVALARTPQRRIFAKFDLRPVHLSPVKVPIRENGDYWFLEAPITSILRAAHTYTEQLLRAVPLFTPSSTF